MNTHAVFDALTWEQIPGTESPSLSDAIERMNGMGGSVHGYVVDELHAPEAPLQRPTRAPEPPVEPHIPGGLFD